MVMEDMTLGWVVLGVLVELALDRDRGRDFARGLGLTADLLVRRVAIVDTESSSAPYKVSRVRF